MLPVRQEFHRSVQSQASHPAAHRSEFVPLSALWAHLSGELGAEEALAAPVVPAGKEASQVLALSMYCLPEGG